MPNLLASVFIIIGFRADCFLGFLWELKQKMSVTVGWCVRQVLVRRWNRRHLPHLGKVVRTLAVKQKAPAILVLIRALEMTLWGKL